MLRVAAGRRDLRGVGHGLDAHRHGALSERAQVRAGAAAGGGRVPDHARCSRADRRCGHDQAGARHRRAEHPGADDLLGRGSGCGGRRGAIPAARHARNRQRARPIRAVEPRRRLPRERRRSRVAVRPDRDRCGGGCRSGDRRRGRGGRRLRRTLRPLRVDGRAGSADAPRRRWQPCSARSGRCAAPASRSA